MNSALGDAENENLRKVTVLFTGNYLSISYLSTTPVLITEKKSIYIYIFIKQKAYKELSAPSLEEPKQSKARPPDRCEKSSATGRRHDHLPAIAT